LALWLGLRYRRLLKVYDTDEPAIDIVITGYQWKWKYDYLGEEGVSFFSNLATPQEEIQGKKEKSEFYSAGSG
jgi:cytochrome c oxidase subunit 2